ncbi:biopolymer transporter ExbD [Lacibacter luteus]|uniref:Biopolymer transporter ExbD n=1 Tax=Lacibacter luteus TaxID=2508719 RepID=A0A4Q1CG82_9BACT|nr:biopolymer transporter ExbD [Lacibacter luteus]RXK59148.1 biopolymer transporter ExbD [Lacibacter luteus]
MAAINTNDTRTARVDFTPMVDLGFLLITFFIFTTELSKPKAFGLHVPDDNDVLVPNQTIESATITLQMKGNGIVDYYEGFENHPIQKGSLTLYKQNSLRDHLVDKRKRIIEQLHTDSNYTVLIAPGIEASYKEIIDVMDEMRILDIRKYVLIDATAQK